MWDKIRNTRKSTKHDPEISAALFVVHALKMSQPFWIVPPNMIIKHSSYCPTFNLQSL